MKWMVKFVSPLFNSTVQLLAKLMWSQNTLKTLKYHSISL